MKKVVQMTAASKNFLPVLHVAIIFSSRFDNLNQSRYKSMMQDI